MILKVNPDSPEPDKIKIAADMLISGKLVVFPTETVYGLGAHACDKAALARVYEVKKRPDNKPLTLLIADIEQLWQITGDQAREDKDLQLVTDKFWPGPLTIIINDLTSGKTGLRMPANKIALELIKRAGVPVAVPSANISGNPAPINARQVIEELGQAVDLILDGGPCLIGESSTVLDLSVSPYCILRQGALSRSELLEAGLDIK